MDKRPGESSSGSGNPSLLKPPGQFLCGNASVLSHEVGREVIREAALKVCCQSSGKNAVAMMDDRRRRWLLAGVELDNA